jgi:heparosan-N-sulfate-glucuronate 5-epimerase
LASEGGVLNRLFGFDWFEEYPIASDGGGTFVLNGFLYALIGLHDFSPHSPSSRALFQRGLRSLQALLPLFDTGQRSLYDLRHAQLASRPNIARWDYHAKHVELLDYLDSVTQGKEPWLAVMARRWAEYAHGTPLKHN